MIDWTTLDKLAPGTLFEDEHTLMIGITVVQPASPGHGVWIAWIGDGRPMVYYSHARVRPLPPPTEQPSPLTTGQARGLMKWAMRKVGQIISAGFLSASEADRIQWVLGLSPGERAFVQAAADDPGDKVTIGVFSDWLLDQQRDKDSGAFAQDWKGKLLGKVRDYGTYSRIAADLSPEKDPAAVAAMECFAAIRKLLGLPEEAS